MAIETGPKASGNAEPTTVPAGWRMVRFGDVVRNVDVAERNPLEEGLERYVGLEHLDPESLHIKRWGLIEEGTSFTRRFNKGQVLFGKRRAYQRKTAVAEWDGICSGDILVFETKEDLLPELLPFIVQSDGFFAHALGTSAGSLSPRTRWRDLEQYEFALPPKHEQRRMAEILWAAENMMRLALKVEELSRRALVLGCQQWTVASNSHDSLDWKVMPLHQCVDILDNLRQPLNSYQRSQIHGSVPYYGANGVIDHVNGYLFDEEIVLLGEDGDHFVKWESWPQAHLVSGKSWVNNHAHVLRAKPCTTNEWIYRFFQHRDIRPFLQDSASMTRRKLTKAGLQRITVHIPTEESRTRILLLLDELDRTSRMTHAHAKACVHLRSQTLATVLQGSQVIG